MIDTDTEGLTAACLELARTAKWSQKPIDAAEITTLAERYLEIAKGQVSEDFIGLPVVVRAVRYITQAHGMPMGDDTGWFYYTLRAVLEVAVPNSGLDNEGKAFLLDMEQGIHSMLEEEE